MRSVRPDKRRHKKGFTLVELMVTIAVVAVLLTLAVPSFNDFFEKARLRAAVDATQSLLAQARQEAVKTNRDVVFSFGGAAGAWCVGANMAGAPRTALSPVPAAAACDCTAPSGCLVSGQPLTIDSTSFRDVTVSSQAMRATIDGRQGTLSALANGSVVFGSGTDRYQLRLDLSQLGQSRACSPAGKRPMPGFAAC